MNSRGHLFCLWTALETCLYFLFKSTSLPLSPGDARGALWSHQNTPAPLLPCDSSTHTCRWAAGPTLGTSLLQARPPPASVTLPGPVRSLILLNAHCVRLNVLCALRFSILTNPPEAEYLALLILTVLCYQVTMATITT